MAFLFNETALAVIIKRLSYLLPVNTRPLSDNLIREQS